MLPDPGATAWRYNATSEVRAALDEGRFEAFHQQFKEDRARGVG